MLQALEDGVYGGVGFKKGENIIGVGISDIERADLLTDGRVKEVPDGEPAAPKLSVVKEEEPKKAAPKKAAAKAPEKKSTAKKTTAKKATTARKTTKKKGA